MKKKGYQQDTAGTMYDESTAGPPLPGYQAEQSENDDALPPYPQNSMSFQGYGNIGFCAPQGF